MDNPVVSKIEADAQPIMWIALTSDRHSAMEMTDFADRYLTDPLKAMPGVASVIIGGERKYAMRLWLDPDRLAGRGITASDVVNALREQNIQVAAGALGRPPVPLGQDFQYTLSTLGRHTTVEEFGNIVIRASGPGGALPVPGWWR